METRKITIVSTRDQKRTVVETDATTLAELKTALNNAGISYDGMTFYEALTRTELLLDESLLPHDVTYKGTVTNDLVFMLTNSNKKIKSGAVSESRYALYEAIVNGGHAAAVYEKYGKNFTNCSNVELAMFLDEIVESEEEASTCNNCAEALTMLVDILISEDYISYSQGASVKKVLSGDTSEDTSPYSDDEIDALVASMPENIR